MAHVSALKREDLVALEPVLAGVEANMGFVPNSMMTMAHMPQLTMAFSMLAGVVFGADLQPMIDNFQKAVPADNHSVDNLSPDLVQLIAYGVSLSAGCLYCQAHTSHSANRLGIEEEKLAQILLSDKKKDKDKEADADADDAPIYSGVEKAVIALALAAGQVPNESSGEQFEALRLYFSERQIVQIVAVISLFGFLNRWNDTLATQLEPSPADFAQRVLSAGGWQIDKHGGV